MKRVLLVLSMLSVQVWAGMEDGVLLQEPCVREDWVDNAPPTSPLNTPQSPLAQATEAASSSGHPKRREFPEVTRIYVMRHGHREDMQNPQWTKTAERPHDPPLSSLGRQQAQHVTESKLKGKIDMIVASPYLRCIQTAVWACRATEIPVIHREEGIGEWVMPDTCPNGRTDTLSNSQLQAILTKQEGNYHISESYESLASRGELKANWQECEPRTRLMNAVFKVSRSHPDKRILFVTHADALLELLNCRPGYVPDSVMPGCADVLEIEIHWRAKKKESPFTIVHHKCAI